MKNDDWEEIKQDGPVALMVVIALILVGVTFGLWQESIFAGFFMFLLLFLWFSTRNE